MSRVKIDKNNRTFILEEKPFFYLADTVWSAFTNITLEEWEYYLDKRKSQGFNVLQINTLPQWDRGMNDVGIYPFKVKEGQVFQFGEWNQGYYDRARAMCKMAVDSGFQLALVVLWLNYVPETWGSKIMPSNIMPKEFVKEYTKKIWKEFEEFEPIYVISGDTDFDTKETIEYYEEALNTLCTLSPMSLKTLHIKRGYDVIPEQLLSHIDFYMFQSGHNISEQKMSYVLPERFYQKYPIKPLINSEPCYEQMGYSRQKYGRFNQFDIRKAAWSSLLSGACAGITYGAHGIWNWYRINSPKNPILGEGFDLPLPWGDALRFMGAWDYGYMKYIFEEYKIGELTPQKELLENNTEEIRIAKTTDGTYLIYMPSNTSLIIKKELNDYDIKMIDLKNKNIAYPNWNIADKKTIIPMHSFESDVLVIAKKEN